MAEFNWTVQNNVRNRIPGHRDDSAKSRTSHRARPSSSMRTDQRANDRTLSSSTISDLRMSPPELQRTLDDGARMTNDRSRSQTDLEVAPCLGPHESLSRSDETRKEPLWSPVSCC